MKDFLLNIIHLIFSFLPIKRNKLLFLSYYGSQYGCSPKYLSKYISKHHPDWEIVWAFTEPGKHQIQGIIKVKYLSLKYFYEIATSGVIVSNFRMPLHFKKRKGQLYIMTWHSSLRLKRIEKDAEDSLKPGYVEMAKEDSKKIDALLSGCRFSTEIFTRAFWYDGLILNSGTPRCDIFFNDNKEKLIKEIRKKLNIENDAKLILYAPTFRQNKEPKEYVLDCIELQENLNSNNNEEWKILVRLHPHLIDKSANLFNHENIIDVTGFDDVQELLLIADWLITDYSSLMFDFMETGKPCLLFVPDLEEYLAKERNLYFDVKALPFPVCKSLQDIQNHITNFDYDYYNNSLQQFRESVGSFENGCSSENVTEFIEKWMTKRK